MGFGFFLKKLVGFFVEPLGVVLILFFIGVYFLYKQKTLQAKLFLLLSIALLLLFSYPPFVNALITPLETQYVKFNPSEYTTNEEITYIHVLGNGHTTDAQQPISSQLSHSGVKRVLEGVILYKSIKNAKLVFTGYKGNTTTSNAKMNARLAEALGVKKEDIVVNGVPVDTKEEALFMREIVASKPFILVTSATHMPRAMMLFNSLGMHPIPAPTNFYKVEFLSYICAPNTYTFHIATLTVHEYFGILWAKLWQNI